MKLSRAILERKRQLPAYGLGIFIFLAGISKFLVLEFWVGYEPQLLVQLLPLTARQLTVVGGSFEALLGLVLLSGRKTFLAALTASIWLLAITVQVGRLGLWDLAIRDLGLTFYALSVALHHARDSSDY